MDYDDIFDTNLILDQVEINKKSNKLLHESLSNLLEDIKVFDNDKLFHYPINKNKYKDYYKLIKYPMNLTTIQSKLEKYLNLDDFLFDLNLIVNNAMTFNPPNNFYHLKAVELRDFIDDLVKSELNNYNIINDTKQPSLPIAWGVYSEDEESEESEEEPMEEDPPNVNPPVDYRPKVFNSNSFLNQLKIFSETNPILPLNTPTIYSKRSRFQKKRLTRKEQELLEKEPYLKNADGSVNANECK